jgi:uncharacterized membrane protein
MGTKGLRILKISHLLFAVMWIGGVMALVSLQLGATPDTKEMMYMGAIAHLIVDEYFLIPGGIGIVITAIIYGMFTKWGFFKQRWLTVKWVITLLLVIIGAGYMGMTIKENAVYAQKMLSENIGTCIYWDNVYHVAIAGIIQIVGFVYIVAVSVIKPWKKKNANQSHKR